ncbi:MAG: zinc-binding alcohol dehydrogenase family protein [Arcicella sp.]|nr:zinc-binding alcohol dehydrogenase family protein [Arcicella sp.]
MKSLVCTKPQQFDYQQIKRPEITSGNAILKVKRIGICGTDLHAFEGTQPFFNYPRILGHELACEVAEIEENSDFKVGDAVTFIPYFSCGKCIACRNKKPNCCTDIQVFGVHIDGGMSEYISVPIQFLVKSQGLSFDELALVEPLAIGCHGVNRANVQANEFVLVMGAGPIGLGTMEFAKIAGAKVIALDVNDLRLTFCQEKLSVDFTINALSDNVLARLREITNNDMPTVIIDATGNLTAIESAFQYLAHGGKYILVGLQKGEISFSHPEFHKREATLMSSRNATRQDFEQVINAMKKGLVKPTTYITHRVNFEQVKDNFESWLNPTNGVIKAIVNFDN